MNQLRNGTTTLGDDVLRDEEPAVEHHHSDTGMEYGITK